MRVPYHADIWLSEYLKDRARFLFDPGKPTRVWLSITDHYEPFWRDRDERLARERVALWRERWPKIAQKYQDSTGKPPQYSFFYPEEEYRPDIMDSLAEMVRLGLGDVEIHLHHDGEGERDFVDRMTGFRDTLFRQHGLLRQVDGQVIFGFIHGNWALDNSRPDGRWCGLNNELQLLRKLGCYADFTMPCGPAAMQARMINTIYWATDDPNQPKSYDRGIPVHRGQQPNADLMMITGPFGIRWGERLKPRLESGELASYDPPTPYRIRRWLDLSPRIGGDIFIKLFSHGTQEKNAAMLLNGGLDLLFSVLQNECSNRGYALHYASAWDMYEGVRAAAGLPKVECVSERA